MLKPEVNKTQTDESYISLLEFFSIIWEKKLLVFIVTAIFSVGSVFFSLSLPNYYKSSALLTQNEDISQSDSFLSQYGGIASMAGINFPSEGGFNSTDYAVAILESRNFTENLESKISNFSEIVFASNGFNPLTNEIYYDEDIYDNVKKKWVRKVQPPKSSEPSILELNKIFKRDILSYYIDQETGYITISIELVSPDAAYDFLTVIINEVNEISRTNDLIENEKNLLFLADQLNSTSKIPVQDSVNKLIDLELKKKMMANVKKDYLLKIIDPPFVPEEKSRPSRALICILGFILGIFISITFIFLNIILKRIRES